MSQAKRLVSVAVAACAALLMSQGAAFAASKCIGAMAKDGAKVAATKGKDIGACLKSGGGADCISEDSAKVDAAAGKVSADFDKNCVATPPTFGVPGVPTGTAAAIAAVASDEEAQLAFSIFGSDAETSSDKAGAKCQTTVSKTYEKAVATYLKEFQGCIKGEDDEAGLESCVLKDSGKAAAALGKIEAGIGKACAGQSVADLFPGSCSDVGLPLLSECVGVRLRCYTCRMENGMHGLHANCDDLDDGTENGSCSAGLPSACELDTGSKFNVQAAVGVIPVPAVGSIDIATGGSSGVNAASCSIREVSPFNLSGIGFICISGSSGCAVGNVDCAGGSTGSTAMSANRNIGTCTGNTDCHSKCNTYCANNGAEALQFGFGCEGHCSLDDSACLTDVECGDRGAGACYGQDGVPAGNICECICVNDAVGSVKEAGEVSCNLGVKIQVENASPCGDGDVKIDFGSICAPVTTGPSSGTFNNFNNVSGSTKVQAFNGADPTCFEYDANDVNGTKIAGATAFFGSTLGDLLVGVDLTCK